MHYDIKTSINPHHGREDYRRARIAADEKDTSVSALVVQATEDLHHGQKLEGLTIRNPFRTPDDQPQK